MTIKAMRMVDLIVSILTLGGAITATVLTHNGLFEILYYIPYVAWEVRNVVMVKKIMNRYKYETTEDEVEDED